MTAIAIIDSGGSNLASLQFALQRLGATSEISTHADVIRSAERVILPGVGAARDAMDKLQRNGLVELIRSLEQPVLGICLGMQLLGLRSQEDDVSCLGVFPSEAERLPASPQQPAPNMGWCSITKREEHPLLKDIETGAWFYFVHSYALPVADFTLASAEHAHSFSAVIGRQNFVAAQFHPERSAAAGSRFLQNFLEWQP